MDLASLVGLQQLNAPIRRVTSKHPFLTFVCAANIFFFHFRLGGHVDMTLGPHWPTGFPGYTPDSLETMKELVHGQIFLEKGESFSGTLPLPVTAPSGNQTGNIVHATPKLVAVLAARTTNTSNSSTIVYIIPDTIKVLSASVSNNILNWTAPSDGRYVVVAAYNRGTGQIQNMYDGTSLILLLHLSSLF